MNNGSTVLVLYEAMDNWAGIIVGHKIEHVRINEANTIKPCKRESAEGF